MHEETISDTSTKSTHREISQNLTLFVELALLHVDLPVVQLVHIGYNFASLNSKENKRREHVGCKCAIGARN